MSGKVLILAAHGSDTDRTVNEGLCNLARCIEADLPFGAVVAAFCRGTPTFTDALADSDADEVVVVPLMASAGYFATTVLPREVARVGEVAGRTVRITDPVGTHSLMADLVADRADALVAAQRFDVERVTLLVIGHGTHRNKASRDATVSLAATLRRRRVCGQVIFAFLDDEPSLENVLERVEHRTVIAIPFTMAAGPHSCHDMPIAMGLQAMQPDSLPKTQCVGDKTIVYDRPVGCDPHIARIISDLAQPRRSNPASSCAMHRCIRVGTRSSALAMWQANHVAKQLRAHGADVEVVCITTSGDRRLGCAIADLASAAPFCDDIEVALRRGDIDLAVHSLKDLALDESPDLLIAAVLPRGDAREALVARDDATLRDLPHGATVGTSSPRRAAQIRLLRSDLVPKPIRGAVDARVKQVQSGAFDAAILAVAGLERIGLHDAITQRFDTDMFPPAPGQAAMAVQVRKDDWHTFSLVKKLNHEPTRQATALELELLRCVERNELSILAAFARVDSKVDLFARVVDASNLNVRDVHVSTCDPETALKQALRNLHMPPPASTTTLPFRCSPHPCEAVVR